MRMRHTRRKRIRRIEWSLEKYCCINALSAKDKSNADIEDPEHTFVEASQRVSLLFIL